MFFEPLVNLYKIQINPRTNKQMKYGNKTKYFSQNKFGIWIWYTSPDKTRHGAARQWIGDRRSLVTLFFEPPITHSVVRVHESRLLGLTPTLRSYGVRWWLLYAVLPWLHAPSQCPWWQSLLPPYQGRNHRQDQYDRGLTYFKQIVQTLRSHEQMGQFRPGSVSLGLPENNLMIRSYLQLPPKLCGDDIRNKYRMRGCLRLDLDKLWSP